VPFGRVDLGCLALSPVDWVDQAADHSHFHELHSQVRRRQRMTSKGLPKHVIWHGTSIMTPNYHHRHRRPPPPPPDSLSFHARSSFHGPPSLCPSGWQRCFPSTSSTPSTLTSQTPLTGKPSTQTM
jgi:hypothetical protein